MPEISVVAPVFNGEMTIQAFSKSVIRVLESMNIESELVLVDDGSHDHSWKLISNLKSEKIRLRRIKLSRNFGQHIAIFAGLKEIESEWIVVMDADLQEDPMLIPILYAEAKRLGNSVVVRNESESDSSIMYKIGREVFYKLFTNLIDFQYDPKVANFGIYEKSLISWITNLHDRYPFFPGLVRQSGFKLSEIVGEKKGRNTKESSYSFIKLFRHATSIVLNQSTRLMRVFVKIGFYTSIFAALGLLVSFAMYQFQGREIIGWYSLVAILLFFFSTTIIVISVVGIYIGSIFEILLNKPIYSIETRI
jgi:glycosyltransferase involved in cell wall biosynthesis